METARPALAMAGLTHTVAHIERLRARFDALPQSPKRDGYLGEKAVLLNESSHPVPAPPPRIGKPGQKYFNTDIVLLDRHLKDIDFLLNRFAQ